MSNINNLTIEGNLTKDADLRFTNSGTPICKFSIANNRFQGTGKDEYANFFDVTIWGKMGEALTKYLTKGKGVIIVGEIRQQRWVDQASQQNRSRIDIICKELSFKGSAQNQDNQPQETPQEQQGIDDKLDDDGIPF